jgi:hypothetical protein
MMAAMYPSLGAVGAPGVAQPPYPGHRRRGREWWHDEHPHHERPHHEHGRHRHHHHDCDCDCHTRHHHDCDCDCHTQHHRCRCHDCAIEPCECICCVGDVDTVVYTRVGERRVLPVEIENERRREAKVKLELSEWTTRAGNPAPVRAVLEPAEEFALEPCGRHKVTLILEVSASQDDAANKTAGKRDALELPRDVESCLVAIADLRLVGCEHRPIRLAAAILPRYCDPFRIGCGCGCC